MEAFIASAEQAHSLASVDFSALQLMINAACSADEVREMLTTLIDAYSMAGSSRTVYQCAVIKALGSVLRRVVETASSSAATSVNHAHRLLLSVDDYILLTLFFNELSTVDDPQLFATIAESMTPLFQQTVPFIYGNGNDNTDELLVDASTVASLRGELQTLRVVVAKRLTAATAESSTHHSNRMAQLHVIDSLRALLLSLLQAVVSDTAEATPSLAKEEEVALAMRQVLEGMLLPLTSAVKALGGGGNSSVGIERAAPALRLNASTTASPVSPMVLTGTLRVLEEFLWRCTENSTVAPLIATGRFAVTRVLGALQQYLVLQQQQQQQQQQSEELTTGVVERGAAAVDVLRTSMAQRSVRRLLSILQRQIVLFPSMEGAVVAALNAFGGNIEMETPFELMRVQDEHNAGSNSGALTVDGEWEMPPSPSSRLRECVQVMAAPTDPAVATDTGGADLDDPTLLQNGSSGVGAGAGKEALLNSTVGLVSANTLVEMVMLSIRRMDIMNEQGIQALHLEGLERMQYNAARRAQREEIQRLRRIEQQGVEGIPVGRLLEHLKESTSMYAKGMQLLDSESSLAVMLRAAFFSVLEAYDALADETEARVREAQALIARALAQLPSSMLDSALDAVCICLRNDLLRRCDTKDASKALPLASAYQLVLQVLFTLFSAQAPVRERGITSLVFVGAAPDAEEAELQSYAAFTIDTENPLEWLQSVSDANSLLGDRKRPREEEASGDNNNSNINNNNNNGDAAAASDGASLFFREDTTHSPCLYSHLLCRVLELLTEIKMPALLLDVLLQCPRITRFVWYYVQKQYCLSAEKARCLLGMWLLKNLAVRRSVCRRYAVNSLLHMASVSSEYPRRLAVTQLGALLSVVGSDGRRVIDKDAEALLVRYAKRQMAAIPVTKHSPSGATAAFSVAKGEEENLASFRGKEMQRLSDVLDRHLAPFLMLCVRQPKELFPALLDVFKECVERQNVPMMHLLSEHVDVRRMCQRLFRTDALVFMSNVMPYLRRHSRNAAALVQKILWAISSELRLMGQECSVPAADMERTALALLGHARVMYDGSEIPLLYRLSSGGTGESAASLRDVRFVAPFISLITAEELKQTYLRSFLHLVQLQLQQQQSDVATEGTKMSNEELHQFIKDVVREVLVRSPVRLSNGAPRGLSRKDLLVYLHRAPHEPRAASDDHTSNVQPSSSSLGTGRAESRGILGSATPSTSAGAAAAPPVAQSAEDLPISLLTTKEVISVVLRLTRTFDETTAELLYGPEEIKNAVRQLMQHNGALSIPSQLIATLILACSIHSQRPQADLVRFVHQEVLLPLAKDATWEKDVQLWRGVLLFAEIHYRECSSFLINLPDQVLIHALRARPQLCDYFREEHGNNASFGHVLGNL